jgi:hypothetical protein
MSYGLYIPAVIVDLPVGADEKLILAKIAEFEKNNKPFYMGNDSIAKLINRSARTAQDKVGQLVKGKLVVKNGFDGRKRKLSLNDYLKREISARQPSIKGPPSLAKSATESNKRTSNNLSNLYK